MVRFNKMTKEEFEIFKAKLIKSYAETISKNMRRSPELALAASEQQINSLLKDGIETKNHYLFNVADQNTKENVGILWVMANVDEDKAFIFDIEMNKEYQGKGYGKETLKELDDFVRGMGIRHIGLNVFADNTTAKALYDKSGYVVTNMNMVKELKV